MQSDFGSYAYTWTAIGKRSLREFLCSLHFDYFMNKAAPKGYRVFDEDATRRAVKAEIFDYLKHGCIDRETAHEWRDELDEIEGADNEHLFAERLMGCEWIWRLWDTWPPIKTRDCPQARAFWDGPWQALCRHWRTEVATEKTRGMENAA